MVLNNNQKAFLALVRAGLWEKDVQLAQYEPFDLKEVYRLSQEQAVVGIVAAGLEHVKDLKLPKEEVLLYIGEAIQLEQRNTAMNSFIRLLVGKLRDDGITTLLVKGQGIAQSYEKPLWRASGDVDLLLSDINYEKAKDVLVPMASNVETEYTHSRHQGMTIDGWEVELHGTLRCSLFKRIDNELDRIQDRILGGEVRYWTIDSIEIALPSASNDIVFVFTHILDHFYHGGVGLRQICDWCRLLWAFQGQIDTCILKDIIEKMGLKTEWGTFAALAINVLGMPLSAMPLYSGESNYQWRINHLVRCIFIKGNFGHNRKSSRSKRNSVIMQKTISLFNHSYDSLLCFFVFPFDSFRLWLKMLARGVVEVMKFR